MRRLALILCVAFASQSPLAAQSHRQVSRWEHQARRITIVRDDWGIPHIYGRTDADAVFGLLSAQAEDAFNRVETNYLDALGRLAEAEGESQVWHDLRARLFMNSDSLRALYRTSPITKVTYPHWANCHNDPATTAPTGPNVVPPTP